MQKPCGRIMGIRYLEHGRLHPAVNLKGVFVPRGKGVACDPVEQIRRAETYQDYFATLKDCKMMKKYL